MICMFTPAGVMVAWKVLTTPESPYDIVDFVRCFKVSEGACPSSLCSIHTCAVRSAKILFLQC